MSAQQIDIHKLIDKQRFEDSAVGEMRSVVYLVKETKDRGPTKGQETKAVRVLLMSSAPQLFDEILHWGHRQQEELVEKLLAELPEDGDMKTINGGEKKTGFVFRAKSVYDDIDVCVQLTR